MSFNESIANFGVSLTLWGFVNYLLGSDPMSPTDIMGIGACLLVFSGLIWAAKKLLSK